jgi:hypothetical protein
MTRSTTSTLVSMVAAPILVATALLAGTEPVAPAAAAEETVQMLFVQSAEGVEFSDGKMTMKGVSPATVFFSDRPERIAGHMTTAEFIPFWGEGADSFSKDPPNATLSIFGEGEPTNLVVEISKPVLNGHELTYDIRILKGTPPAGGAECTLFIDIIGMPLTPFSYAGVARRSFRRAVIY